MRTTIDLPANLLRQARAHAARRGITLRDLCVEALRAALAAGDASRHDRSRLGEHCLFPLIRGAGGPALRSLTPERLNRLLDEEDAVLRVRPVRSGRPRPPRLRSTGAVPGRDGGPR